MEETQENSIELFQRMWKISKKDHFKKWCCFCWLTTEANLKTGFLNSNIEMEVFLYNMGQGSSIL